MVYLRDGGIVVRDLRRPDADAIAAAEVAQGWANASPEKYLKRLADRDAGRAIALAAELDGEVAGYVNVYPGGNGGAFAGRGWPEIVDFGVLEKFRRRGVGSRLMDAAKAVAARYADAVYLGVGLHSGYGSAQRMYVKRGYVPDGSGVWYRDTACAPYAPCINDDELVLYLSKKLR